MHWCGSISFWRSLWREYYFHFLNWKHLFRKFCSCYWQQDSSPWFSPEKYKEKSTQNYGAYDCFWYTPSPAAPSLVIVRLNETHQSNEVSSFSSGLNTVLMISIVHDMNLFFHTYRVQIESHTQLFYLAVSCFRRLTNIFCHSCHRYCTTVITSLNTFALFDPYRALSCGEEVLFPYLVWFYLLL